MAEKEVPGKGSPRSSRSRSLRYRWDRWASGKFLSPKNRERAGKIALLLGLSLAIALLLAPPPHKFYQKYKVGDLAQEEVKAVRDFLVEDVETSAKRRQELLAQVPPVYDLDEQAAARIQERLQQAFAFMRQEYRKLAATLGQTPSESFLKTKTLTPELVAGLQKLKPEFDKLLGADLPPATFKLLVEAGFPPTIEALVNQVVSRFCRRGVINRSSLPKSGDLTPSWNWIISASRWPATAGRWPRIFLPPSAGWPAIWCRLCSPPTLPTTWPRPRSASRRC